MIDPTDNAALVTLIAELAAAIVKACDDLAQDGHDDRPAHLDCDLCWTYRGLAAAAAAVHGETLER